MSTNHLTAGPVTEAQRKAAEAHDRDTREIQHAGVTEALRLSWRATQAVVAAYKAGRTEGLGHVLRRQFWKGVPVLAEGMLVSWLAGYLRSYSAVKLSLSTYDDAKDFVERRLYLTPRQLSKMQSKFNTNAVFVYHRASAKAEEKLEEAMAEIIGEGMHVRQGVMRLHEAFDKAGIMPQTSYTLENIYRTQVALAYSAGRRQAERRPEVADILVGYRYVTVGDDRVRPSHQLLEGVTLPKDHEFWQTCFPPNGWSCFVEGTQIQGRPLWVSKAKYSGQVVEINTAAGARLTVTPNHPIATNKGWVAAGSLNEGDYLFGNKGDVKLVAGMRVNDQNRPAAIEDLFNAGRAYAIARSPLDFHGDARGFTGEVEVVFLDRKLEAKFNARQAMYSVGNISLAGVNSTSPAVNSFGTFCKLFDSLANACVVSSLDILKHFEPGCFLKCGPSQQVTLTFGAQAYTAFSKMVSDSLVRDAILFGQNLRAYSRLVFLHQTGRRFPHLFMSQKTKLIQPPLNGGARSSVSLRKVMRAFSSLVTRDQIVKLCRRDYTGHVFDLQTKSGGIIADNLLASNCRCVAIPLFAPPDDGWVEPPDGPVDVDGEEVEPGPDKDFEFDPGDLYGDILDETSDAEEGGDFDTAAGVYGVDAANLKAIIEDMDSDELAGLAEVLGVDVEDLENGDLELSIRRPFLY